LFTEIQDGADDDDGLDDPARALAVLGEGVLMQGDDAEADETDEARKCEDEAKEGQGDAFGQSVQAVGEPSLEFGKVSSRVQM
jgi:hypothetical protein